RAGGRLLQRVLGRVAGDVGAPGRELGLHLGAAANRDEGCAAVVQRPFGQGVAAHEGRGQGGRGDTADVGCDGNDALVHDALRVVEEVAAAFALCRPRGGGACSLGGRGIRRASAGRDFVVRWYPRRRGLFPPQGIIGGSAEPAPCEPHV